MLNRDFVYFVRKHMPENQALHNLLAKQKLKEFSRTFLADEDVALGESDPSAIAQIVRKAEDERPGQVQKLVAYFDRFLEIAGITFSEEEYQEKKQAMLFDCMAYGFDPDEFIYYRLSERTAAEKRTYVTSTYRYMMQYLMSDFKDLQFLFDKALTYEKFKKYYHREAVCVSKSSDFDAFSDFCSRHDELVIKQVSASSGRGVELEKADHEHLREQFDRILAGGRSVIEERIVQADELAVFNDSSVNTVRIMVFQTKRGLTIGPCFFRAGRKGKFTDNGGGTSGGIMTGVNRETGVLDSDGQDEYLHVFEVHPDSGIRFQGFQLPEWDAVIEMVKEMSALIPKIGYIGWDMCYSTNGWTIVEANGASHMMNQLVYNCGCMAEIAPLVEDRMEFLNGV